MVSFFWGHKSPAPSRSFSVKNIFQLQGTVLWPCVHSQASIGLAGWPGLRGRGVASRIGGRVFQVSSQPEVSFRDIQTSAPEKLTWKPMKSPIWNTKMIWFKPPFFGFHPLSFQGSLAGFIGASPIGSPPDAGDAKPSFCGNYVSYLPSSLIWKNCWQTFHMPVHVKGVRVSKKAANRRQKPTVLKSSNFNRKPIRFEGPLILRRHTQG